MKGPTKPAMLIVAVGNRQPVETHRHVMAYTRAQRGPWAWIKYYLRFPRLSFYFN